jgi:hypothetical protein
MVNQWSSSGWQPSCNATWIFDLTLAIHQAGVVSHITYQQRMSLHCNTTAHGSLQVVQWCGGLQLSDNWVTLNRPATQPLLQVSDSAMRQHLLFSVCDGIMQKGLDSELGEGHGVLNKAQAA